MRQRIYFGRRDAHGPEVMVMEADGQCRMLNPARSLELQNHSPTGFEWGYGGSGPAQLALALLLDYYGADAAQQTYHFFKSQVVARMPAGEWELTGSEIQFWMQTNIDNSEQEASAYFSEKWDGATQRNHETK